MVTAWIGLSTLVFPVVNCTWTLWRPSRPAVSQVRLRVQVVVSP